MRSCTGATISLIVFVAICAISMHRLVLYLQEENRTFFRHEQRGAFEGVASTIETDKRVAPEGHMTADQIQAIESFYFGVGFVTTPNFREYDELGFGSWKFYQHVYVIGEEGNVEEEVSELETANCFAYINDFHDLSASGQRLVSKYDARNDMECVRKRDLSSLQPKSPEHWLSQPRYSFQFVTCTSLNRLSCHSQTLVQEWRKNSRVIVYHNQQSLDSQKFHEGDMIQSKAQFIDLEINRFDSTQVNLVLQVDSVSRPENIFSVYKDDQVSFAYLTQETEMKNFNGDPEQVIVAIDLFLSSDHVRYEIRNPQVLDWLGFIGGISVVVFLLGKSINHVFFRKQFISPMMNQLFQVQDVSKINNVKRQNYTDKAINRTTSPYKQNLSGPRGGRTSAFSASSSVHPMDQAAGQENFTQQAASEIDHYIADLGRDRPDFAAFKKLCLNRKSLNEIRGGRFMRMLCCRQHNFDVMMRSAKQHIRDELDIVRYIKKQRTTSNLLWGLSTPWQRSLCRSQANHLIQDKLESEFAALKLSAVRRLDETAAWHSSSEEDPLNKKLIEHIKTNPCAVDFKFMKRYIAVCTPDALKFKESRRRHLQREFAPSELPEKQIFTQNKAELILERRRIKALQKDMKKAKTQNTARKSIPHGDVDMSEQYSQRSRSSMPRIELAFQQRQTNKSVVQHNKPGGNRQPQVQQHITTELSEEDYEQMQQRMEQIRNAYQEEDGESSQGDDQHHHRGQQQTTHAAFNAGGSSNPYGLNGMMEDRSNLHGNLGGEKANFLQVQQNRQMNLLDTADEINMRKHLTSMQEGVGEEKPVEWQTARTNIYSDNNSERRLTKIDMHKHQASQKSPTGKGDVKSRSRQPAHLDEEEHGSKNKLDNSSFL